MSDWTLVIREEKTDHYEQLLVIAKSKPKVTITATSVSAQTKPLSPVLRLGRSTRGDERNICSFVLTAPLSNPVLAPRLCFLQNGISSRPGQFSEDSATSCI